MRQRSASARGTQIETALNETPAPPEPVARLLAGIAARTPSDTLCPGSPASFFAPGALGAQSAPPQCYTLVLGEVPFAGSLPSEAVARALREPARSRRAELVGLAWALQALAPGGRAVLLVPEGFLSASTEAHRAMRRRLVDENALQAVIRLAPGWYKPRTSAAILALCKGGSTDWVWFCDVAARPRDRRRSTQGESRTASRRVRDPALSEATADLIDVVTRWEARAGSERERPRTAASFCVPRPEIAPPEFDLGTNRYRRAESSPSIRPHEILAELAGLEAEIFHGIRQLVGMLK